MLKLPKPFTLQKGKKKIKQQSCTNPAHLGQTSMGKTLYGIQALGLSAHEDKGRQLDFKSLPSNQLIGHPGNSPDRMGPHQLPYKGGSDLSLEGRKRVQ